MAMAAIRTVAVRQQRYLAVARWWRKEAERNNKPRDSQEHWYAENMELLAADMERHPTAYEQSSSVTTDWQLFKGRGEK